MHRRIWQDGQPWPPFINMMVGTPLSDNFFIISRLSALLSFRNTIRSPYLSASSANFGARAAQGGQVGSQMSSTTGLLPEASTTQDSYSDAFIERNDHTSLFIFTGIKSITAFCAFSSGKMYEPSSCLADTGSPSHR